MIGDIDKVNSTAAWVTQHLSASSTELAGSAYEQEGKVTNGPCKA